MYYIIKMNVDNFSSTQYKDHGKRLYLNIFSYHFRVFTSDYFWFNNVNPNIDMSYNSINNDVRTDEDVKFGIELLEYFRMNFTKLGADQLIKFLARWLPVRVRSVNVYYLHLLESQARTVTRTDAPC